MAQNRLLLIDGHSMAYRAFYALPAQNFNTTSGQPTNAVYGFTAMLINLLKEFDPTHIGVAFDVSRRSFRTELFADYKANRAQSPDEFKGQVELIKEVLDGMGIRRVEKEGYEADDLLATLATQATVAGFSTDIVTGDRDSFALVSPHVTVLYPKKGVSDLAVMTEEAIEVKYKLTPSQYPDFAALRGDPSDNLPGIPGVGEKTAQKWISEYGSLSALVERADTVTGKVGVSLRDNIAQLLVNRRITELVRDVPLDVSVNDLDRRTFSLSDLNQLFDTLQFSALRTRVAALPGAVQPEPSENASDPGVEIPPEINRKVFPEAALQDLESLDGPIAVAIQGEFANGSGSVSALAVCSSHQIHVVHSASAQQSTALLKWLSTCINPITLHDGKTTLWALATAQIDISQCKIQMDTALAGYLIDPGQRSYELTDLVRRELGHSLTAPQDQLSMFGENDSVTNLVQSATLIWELGRVLSLKLAEFKLEPLLVDIEIPTEVALAQMEHVGIAVDSRGLEVLSTKFGEQMHLAESASFELVGHQFNLASPKQLQEVLFSERGLPKTKKIKTGFTTDAEALNSLYAQTNDPLLKYLLGWREDSKLRQTVEGLIPLVDGHGRIHTTFRQTVAATGRLSSMDPNLQNIPVRTQAGRRIRAAFVVGEGFECLLTADYSQIELRIMAHLSQDEALIEAFNSGEDLHESVARKVFDVTEVTPDLRRQIKAMSYGLAYGLSPYGLAAQLDISTEDAKIMMEDYFRRFGGIRAYLADVVEVARGKLYTETMYGRRRMLPDLVSENRQRREIAERMALNAPIQGSAADIVKIAMLKVDQALQKARFQSRLLLQVHDELVLEVATGEREAVTQLVSEQMRSAAELLVPLDVNVGTGPNWDAAAH
ncbi:MAG: DNA polymerase I [Candidatus Nanopelagicales bacterium]|nr:DNA polymerase I [Actinomycetota bacterium]NCG03167.1 DNA polymerase I [Actinomycetales bacterium]